MPKRAPTPPPADDTRFFTVINPYPEQPYLALEDSKTFARWVACIIGEEHLLAFHHKPKSPNVVIIETSKTGPDFHRLMGEHRWGAFLSKPGSGEVHEASYIFPCTLTTTRAVEKAGWICRDVTSAWFKRWSPKSNSHFVHPYPQPRHCEPPSEDVTRYPLCRPIPKSIASESATARPKQHLSSMRAVSPSAASSDDAATPSSSEFSDYPSTPPPGLTAPIARFVPAIHGADVPKASDLIVSLSALSRAQRQHASDTDDEEEEADAEKKLCRVHGALCVSGICKEGAARKREALFAERARQREEERNRRGLGRGGRQGHHGRRDARSGDGQVGNDAQRPVEMPAHLKSWSTIAKGASPTGSGRSARPTEDPKSRLRDDIRVEMAARKYNGATKPPVSVTARPMPAHLRKGASKESAPGASSSSSIFASRSTASQASIATSSGSVPLSAYATSEDGHSVTSSESDSSHLLAARESPDSQRGPWGTGINWRAYAGIREGDAESVATGATGDAFKNPWKHVQSKHATTPRWASAVEEAFHEAGIRAAWDEDESDEDAEPF
ncbi:hypothetical protein FKP32DRAFT_1654583 [Trametes sanguinea]|nr:hypothetical protein FKP32DRAFT_1654583 [Trametes sanguinea]